jgi:DNA-binding NtrC family response regulator
MSPSILIVDDDPEARLSLAELLGRATRASVASAGSLREGLQRLEEEPWNIVLADERLPDGRGVELLERARRQRPGAARALVTGYPTLDLAIDAVNRAHVDRLVVRPFDPAALVAWAQAELAAGPPGRETLPAPGLPRPRWLPALIGFA